MASAILPYNAMAVDTAIAMLVVQHINAKSVVNIPVRIAMTMQDGMASFNVRMIAVSMYATTAELIQRSVAFAYTAKRAKKPLFVTIARVNFV